LKQCISQPSLKQVPKNLKRSMSTASVTTTTLWSKSGNPAQSDAFSSNRRDQLPSAPAIAPVAKRARLANEPNVSAPTREADSATQQQQQPRQDLVPNGPNITAESLKC